MIEHVVGFFFWIAVGLDGLELSHHMGCSSGPHAEFDVVQQLLDLSADLSSCQCTTDNRRGSCRKSDGEHHKDWCTPVTQPLDIAGFADNPAPQDPASE